MSNRPPPELTDTEGPGRRLIIERPPVIVEDVSDFDVDDSHDVYVWTKGKPGKPAAWFAAGTARAVYFEGAQPDPLAQAG